VKVQAALGRGIDGIPDFLGRYGGRFNIKPVLKASLADQILEYEFSHGGPADITMAHKDYLFHWFMQLR
jgi:hypothetical protein